MPQPRVVSPSAEQQDDPAFNLARALSAHFETERTPVYSLNGIR